MNSANSSEMPPNRSMLETELRNMRTMSLHKFSVAECVNVINDENRSVFTAVEDAAKDVVGFIERVERRFDVGGRLIYIGAGTSGRLGVLDASEIPPTFNENASRIMAVIAGGDAALRLSSEGQEDDRAGAENELDNLHLTDNDTLLGIAAGGTTPFVLGALSYAKNCCCPDIFTSLIACVTTSKPVDVDHLITIKSGPEVLTGSTRMKAGTATKMVLNTISTTLMVRSGKVYENLMIDVKASNNKLYDRAVRIVADLTRLGRAESLALLRAANGSVKVAIVMHRCGKSCEEAESLLDASGGRLGSVIENHAGCWLQNP